MIFGYKPNNESDDAKIPCEGVNSEGDPITVYRYQKYDKYNEALKSQQHYVNLVGKCAGDDYVVSTTDENVFLSLLIYGPSTPVGDIDEYERTVSDFSKCESVDSTSASSVDIFSYLGVGGFYATLGDAVMAVLNGDDWYFNRMRQGLKDNITDYVEGVKP